MDQRPDLFNSSRNNVVKDDSMIKNTLNNPENSNKNLGVVGGDAGVINNLNNASVNNVINNPQNSSNNNVPNLNNNNNPNNNNPFQQNPQQVIQPSKPIENEIQKRFRNSFMSNNLNILLSEKANTLRNILKVISIIMILIVLIALEIQCLYFNNCYGESFEMTYWVSQTIVPVNLIFFFLSIICYFSVEYVSKPMINILTVIYILTCLFFLTIGIITIVIVVTSNASSLSSNWGLLSVQSQVYYYNNSLQNLFNIFSYKMITTGAFYIFYGFMSIIIAFIANKHNDSAVEDWRPKLESKVSDDRAGRFSKYFELFQQEHERLLANEKNDGGAHKIPNQNINNNNMDGIGIQEPNLDGGVQNNNNPENNNDDGNYPKTFKIPKFGGDKNLNNITNISNSNMPIKTKINDLDDMDKTVQVGDNDHRDLGPEITNKTLTKKPTFGNKKDDIQSEFGEEHDKMVRNRALISKLDNTGRPIRTNESEHKEEPLNTNNVVERSSMNEEDKLNQETDNNNTTKKVFKRKLK